MQTEHRRHLLDLQVEEMLCLVCDELIDHVLGVELGQQLERNRQHARHVLYKHLYADVLFIFLL